MNALGQASCLYSKRASLAVLADCFIRCWQAKIEFVSNLRGEDLRTLVGESSVYASRSVLLFRYFCACFGEDIVRLLLVPEFTGSDAMESNLAEVVIGIILFRNPPKLNTPIKS
jgi:hypothetical protein